MNVSVWWKHAVVYAVDLHTGDGLKGVVKRMDAMQALGVDAVLLSGLQSGTDAGIDPAAGTMDDFDEVLREASTAESAGAGGVEAEDGECGCFGGGAVLAESRGGGVSAGERGGG